MNVNTAYHRSAVASWFPSVHRAGKWFVIDLTASDFGRDFYAVCDDFGNLVRVPS